MHIWMVTPAPKGSLNGNRASANRWATLLRKLGHRVTVATDYQGQACDIMVALHAWRSAQAIAEYARLFPGQPLVVVLTGTDAYRFIHSHRETTLASLEAATHLVGIHKLVGNVLPKKLLPKLRIILQSAKPITARNPAKRHFRICFAGHLREEKDPLCAASAVRDLPQTSRIRLDAYGGAHSPEWATKAETEMQQNSRYRWHGEILHAELRRVMSKSHLLVLPSIMEGGANVASEAIMARLPIIASDIEGNVGLLGEDYPGYYPVGNADALKYKLLQAETDPGYYQALVDSCDSISDAFLPEREQAGWAKLIEDTLNPAD